MKTVFSFFNVMNTQFCPVTTKRDNTALSLATLKLPAFCKPHIKYHYFPEAP